MCICVETVDYNVIVAIKGLRPFLLGVGLRKRDPLSLYLVILRMEGLSKLLKHYEGRSEIHGVKVSRRAHFLTYLLFTDNCFLLFFAGHPIVNLTSYMKY